MKKSFLVKLSMLALAVCSLLCIGTACKEEHVHSYIETVTIPTCTEQGYTTYSCGCGDSYVDDYVSALGHEFTNYVSDNNATCTENGTETATCNHTDCQETHTRTEANSAIGHKFTNYVSDNNATCTANGTETATCNHTGCQETHMRTEEDSMLAHTYDEEVVETRYLKDEATCTDKAIYYKSCACGATGTETFEYGEANGHSFNDAWIYNTAYHWHTSNCGHVDEISDKQEHSYGKGNTCSCGYVNTTCYIVLWKNYDDSILETDENVPFSTTPTYNGNTPTKEGNEQYTYTFSGWSPTISRVTDDIVYIAQFAETVNQYTVTWQNYDGTVLETDSVDYGTMPVYNGATPTRDNGGLSYVYQFSGWNPTVSAVTGVCVYVAQFTEQQLSEYTVNYDANGGTGAPSTQTKYKSSNLKLSSTVPTREGYTFIGWNNLYEETIYQAGDTFTSNFNVTMFAMWAETCDDCDGEGTITSTWPCDFCDGAGRRRKCNSCESYSIKQVIGQGYSYFQCNSCASTSTSTSTCNWCDGEGRETTTNTCSDCKGLTYIKPVAPTTQSIAARSITLTKIDGYEYKIEGGEWQSSNVFENLKYSTTYTFYQRKTTEDGMPFGVTSAALTVSTQTTTLYYIEYELADGQNIDSNPTSYYSTGNNITLKTPTKENYDFAGWLYNGDIVTEIIASWCSDITLTATWTPTKYVITYELDGGTSENVLFYTIETETFALIAPRKEGYTFLGWTGSNSETVSLTVTIPKGSYGELSYTAHWSINQYTISFVTSNGQVFDSITQDYNTAITLPKPTWTERSFVGWFDESLSEQFTSTTMPAENVTLYAKWINYEVFLCVDNLTGLSVNGDATDGATYNVTAIDTDNNPVKVTAQLLSGSQTEGTSITVRFVANGLYGVYAMQMVRDIKVYGMPTIQYDTQKDYINASDSLVASLFDATATDTYGEALFINVSIKETEYSAGDTITLILSATDITGNTTIVEIENVKYYGTPTIIRDETVTEIKASDTIGNQLFGVFATDSFGEALMVTTVKESGTFAGGYTITIKSSATDSKGNTAYITYNVKIYGLPTITSAAKTNFKEGEEITLSSLGVVAKDSFGNVLDNVTLSLTDGTHAAGNTLTYLVTATDHLGNVNTKMISVKVYGTPTITYDTNKTAIKATDKISASLLSAAAKDSFGNSLTVTATLENGEIKGASCITVKLVATDRVGNTYSIITDEIKVYAQGDIKLTYNAALSNNIKKTSCGEEFNAVATDTFGEACTITIQPASGYSLTGGATINLYLVAMDKAGNTYTSEMITEKNIYDTPTLSYAREYDYIFANDNPYLLFSVKDSFGADRLFDIEIVSGSLQELGIIVYRITAEDKMGNKLDCEYSLEVVGYDENGLVIREYDGCMVLIDYRAASTIVVSEGVQVLAKDLFVDDTAIKSIILPDSIIKLDNGAFRGCSSLTEITLPFVGGSKNATTNKYFGYLFGANSYNENSNYVPSSLKKVTITSATSIGSSAFYNCSSLTSIVIPDSVTDIGSSAFSGCSNLTEITLPFVGATKSATGYQAVFGYIFGYNRTSSISSTSGATYQYYDSTSSSSYKYYHYYIPASLKKVTITSATSIGSSAFRNCSSLTEITLPFVGATKDGTSNTHFGYIFGASSYDFNSSYVPTSLKKVTITSATSIGNDAFYKCSSLTEIVIPDSVKRIGDRAFYNCSSLTSVVIGDSVTSIGRFAFHNCSSLTEIVIPDSVTSIGESAFAGCSALIKVNYLGTIDSWAQIEFSNSTASPVFYAKNLYINNQLVMEAKIMFATKITAYAFAGCSSLTSVVIPESVTSIGDYAFHNCSSLTEIVIPDSVTSIGESAFAGCSALIKVNYLGTIDSWAQIEFSNSTASPVFYAKNLYINNQLVMEAKIMFATKITAYAFAGCSSLTSVVIPESVTSIGDYAFYNCSGLTSVVIPDGVTSIGDYAFYNCSGLTSVVIPDGVTSIGSSAFSGCSSLQYNLKGGLKYLGSEDNCYLYLAKTESSVATVTIDDNCKFIGSSAFYNCSDLMSIIIPDSVISIGSYAFYNCSGLTSVVIPDGVTSIGESAFAYCRSLTEVACPTFAISYIPKLNLKTVIITSGDSIDYRAFAYCSSLTEIVIPDSVTSIGSEAFLHCISLTSVVIGDSVTSIGYQAFYYCSSLTSVKIPYSVQTMGSDIFDGCSTSLKIYCATRSRPDGWSEYWNRWYYWEYHENGSTGYPRYYSVYWGY